MTMPDDETPPPAPSVADMKPPTPDGQSSPSAVLVPEAMTGPLQPGHDDRYCA